MAKKGLRFPVIAKRIVTNNVVSYINGTNFAKMIKLDVKVEKNSAEMYADDALDESDTSFKKATLTGEVNDFGLEISAMMLGHTYDSTNTQEDSAGDDSAPYMGYGTYIVRQKNGVLTYIATWFPKVKWEEPDQSDETSGDNASLRSAPITGTIMKDELQGNKWRIKREFTNEADTINWLKSVSGINGRVEKPVFSLEGGAYTGTKSVTITSTTNGASIYYTTNGTTPSATNGTLYATTPVSVSASMALRAIAVKSGMVNSDLAGAEYIIS